MSINAQQRQEIKRYLAAFDFSGLFTDATVGWDWPEVGQKLRVPFDGSFLALDTVAEKRGVKILRVPPDLNGEILSSDQRKKLEKAVTPLATEHVLIFTDAAKTKQVWLWTSRIPGKPISYRELIWEKGKANELLLQKLSSISFTISEEESLDITGVVERLRDALDRDKVTKKFYKRFKTQKDAFRKFIKGISDSGLLDWYTSLMLNRLMFCYFLQRKGFLDGEENYLSNRLERVRDEFGNGKFHSFYKMFLRRLFHEGLGLPKNERTDDLKKLVGDVPYLNGGIFEEHKIEREHPGLHIPDEAFEKVFAFLDDYDWHLDDRPIASGKEINPEILGYVFEQYTNQKEMGAYYTKEDITDYIAKNCIVPFLLDAAEANLGDSWNLLSDDPDRYIYPAVGHGIFCDYPTNAKLHTPLPLPDYIERGVDTAKPDLRKRRMRWNESATPELGLPTEIWRETVARRERCEELQRKLRTGEVRSVNDLITLNLNIRQFAQDVVENAAPDLLLALFKAIRKASVLDPTCGSGAFLFAALNILEPLYRASLDRMRALLGDWETRGDKSHPNYRKEFAAVLDQVGHHPNENYFIFKSIIVHNLYGVDIMEEAVEICKLRLFLKLAAQLEPGQEIEPLPDIDFNIRAGNTLVGYASRDEVRRCMTQFGDGQMRLGVEDELQSYSRFEEAAENVDRAFQLFHQMQDEFGMNAAKFREQKRVLSERLQTLRDQLNRFLAADYNKRNLTNDDFFHRWRDLHHPFHWFVEFFGILNGGGFDVVIGNPPYVSAAKVRKEYAVKNLATEACPDIYAWVLERSASLLHDGGRSGMIVPMSLSFSGDFDSCRRLLLRAYGENWFSSFGRIPAALFSFDVRVRNTIHIGHKSRHPGGTFTTRLHRWFEAARPPLFQAMEYAPYRPALWKYRIPKLNTARLAAAFERAFTSSSRTLDTATSSRATKHTLYFKKSAYNWLNFCRSLPPCYEGNRRVEHTKFGNIYFPDAASSQLALLLANGKLMMIFWFAIADDFDVTRWNFAEFPADLSTLSSQQRDALLSIAPRLEAAMEENLQYKLNAGRRVGNYNLAKCRGVTDESDMILADALGFRDVRNDIELYYAQTIKTDFSDPESD